MTKKIIHGFLVMILAVVITGCGVDSKENPPPADGPYSFYNATTPLTITSGGGTTCTGTTTCSLTTVNSDTNSSEISVELLEFGLAKAGETITMRPFPIAYGFLTETVVTTDTNGRATFIYNLPDDYNAIRGQDITIQAVYLDSTVQTVNSADPSEPKILLTQDFVLQFR